MSQFATEIVCLCRRRLLFGPNPSVTNEQKTNSMQKGRQRRHRGWTLTDYCQIVADAAGLGVPEIHSAPVNALVVPPDVVDDELSGFRHRTEVGPGAEHFRCRPVPGLAHRLASHVEAATKQIINQYSTSCVRLLLQKTRTAYAWQETNDRLKLIAGQTKRELSKSQRLLLIGYNWVTK